MTIAKVRLTWPGARARPAGSSRPRPIRAAPTGSVVCWPATGSMFFGLTKRSMPAGQDLAPGSYVIPAAQPEYRKLRVLLDTSIDMEADFLAEQERRRARDMPDEIYDVTAWSLPLMFNVDTLECRRAVASDGMSRVQPDEQPPGRLSQPDAAVAFLAAGESRATAKLLAAALRAGLTVQINERAFVHDGNRYPSGTLIFPLAGNDENLPGRLQVLATETGANLTGVSSSWISEGPDFGSNRVNTLYPPRIALAWDQNLPTAILPVRCAMSSNGRLVTR